MRNKDYCLWRKRNEARTIVFGDKERASHDTVIVDPKQGISSETETIVDEVTGRTSFEIMG